MSFFTFTCTWKILGKKFTVYFTVSRVDFILRKGNSADWRTKRYFLYFSFRIFSSILNFWQSFPLYKKLFEWNFRTERETNYSFFFNLVFVTLSEYFYIWYFNIKPSIVNKKKKKTNMKLEKWDLSIHNETWYCFWNKSSVSLKTRPTSKSSDVRIRTSVKLPHKRKKNNKKFKNIYCRFGIKSWNIILFMKI